MQPRSESLPRAGAPEPVAWWGWGAPEQAVRLPDAVRELLRGGLGVRGPRPAPTSPHDVRLPPPRLADRSVEALSRIVGPHHAHADPESRLRHAAGKSTLDLLRLRTRRLDFAPDLVLEPHDHEEVSAVLAVCGEHHVAVVPFGGGTSVVGGLRPDTSGFAGAVTLDLHRMNTLVDLDPDSRLATLEPGLRGPQAEALLASHGYTIGHFPQSFQYATLGGFAAARSSGQASAGYGRFDELVMAMRVATPAGTLELGRAPRTAAGPDLRQLILGSEGALGVITSLTVQVRPVPERRLYEGWRFASFADGTLALRRLAQDGPLPSVLRLSDEAETALNLARPSQVGAGSNSGSLAIVGYEGTPASVEAVRAGAGAVLEAAGGVSEPEAGEAWERERYRGPYLRDALLDAGALVETVETASFWSSLPRLYDSVASALRESLTAQGTPPVILCHISHVYPTGASLYFTVACAQVEDPVAQWQAAKATAGRAILASRGSITHHHGVGSDHLPFFGDEIGELGLQALRALKRELDPRGILNPGILIPT